MGDEQAKDWEGRPVPENEPLNKVITIWTTQPHMSRLGYDEYWERSYNEFIQNIEYHLDNWLGNFTEAELRSGVELKIRLRKVRLETYLEAMEETE